MDDDIPADHDPCEACSDLVCPSPMCVVSSDCMKAGASADPSIWTAYQLVVHARCVPAFDAELEDWAKQEGAHDERDHGDCTAP